MVKAVVGAGLGEQPVDIAVLSQAGDVVFVSKGWLAGLPLFSDRAGTVGELKAPNIDWVGNNFFALCREFIGPNVQWVAKSFGAQENSLTDHIEAMLGLVLNGADTQHCFYAIEKNGELQHYELTAEACSNTALGAVIRHRARSNSIFLAAGIPLDSNFYEALFNNLVDGIIYQNLEGYIELANEAAQEILDFKFEGNNPDEPNKQSLLSDYWTFLNEDGQKLSLADNPILRVLTKGAGLQNLTLGVVRPDKELVWLKLNVAIINSPDTNIPHGVLISFVNITAETEAHTALEKASERLRLALDGASIGIWDWYVEDAEMIWDDQMYRLYGMEPRQYISVKEAWEHVAHPDDNQRVLDELGELLKTKRDTISEFRVLLPDKSIRHLRAYARAVLDEDGLVQRVVGMNWDVTKEVEAEERLAHIAFTDELTSLPNRLAFSKKLKNTMKLADKYHGKVAMLIVDLDHFKDINDSYGHPVGDSLICEVVARLKEILVGDEYLARIGGDEFALILDNVRSHDAALHYSRRIQKIMAEPIYLMEGPVVNARVSMGVALFPDDGEDAVALIKAADLAMHQAKKSGRNTVLPYKQEYSSSLEKKIFLEEELRSAIRDEELMLYYQPIIDLSTEKIVGCEALLRWVDRAGKFVSPVDFIPVAEESGLIYELGNWINATAFKQLKLWQTLHTDMKYISVNVSPHQLQNADFVKDIQRLLDIHNVDPRHIQLEITEGTFLQESLNTQSQLRILGEMGFRLAIDDFGTGYSSLAYLKRFAVDVIKIDRSFVMDLEDDPADRDIVKAIIAMTTSLGFDTLVEGVETREQSLIVGALGCGYGQGYLYGKPTFADDYAEQYIGLKSVANR